MKRNLTMAEQLEELRNMGYFDVPETPEAIEEAYAEAQKSTEEESTEEEMAKLTTKEVMVSALVKYGCDVNIASSSKEINLAWGKLINWCYSQVEQGLDWPDEVPTELIGAELPDEEGESIPENNIVETEGGTMKAIVKAMREQLTKNGYDVAGFDNEEVLRAFTQMQTQTLIEEEAATSEAPEIPAEEPTPEQKPVVPPTPENIPVVPPTPENAKQTAAPVTPPTPDNAPVIPPTPGTSNNETPKKQTNSKLKLSTEPAEVMAYIVWKQLNSDSLHTKDYVSEKMLDSYCKQKMFGVPAIDFTTKKPNVFTEEQAKQVQGVINTLLEMNSLKKVVYGSTVKYVGYVINPSIIADFCYNAKCKKTPYDVVYVIKDKVLQIDCKTGYCANRGNGKLTKMGVEQWKALFELGKFVGVVNRNTDEYTVFKKEESTPKSEPVAPVSEPQVPMAPATK